MLRPTQLTRRVVVAALLLTAPALRASDSSVTITNPARDGTQAACRVVVGGSAVIKQGEHVWIFAARKDYAELGLYWLQGPAVVDPLTHKFSLASTLGVKADVGADFTLAVGLFDDGTHTRLKEKFLEVMTTGQQLPITFPPTITDPQYRTVSKVSHNGC